MCYFLLQNLNILTLILFLVLLYFLMLPINWKLSLFHLSDWINVCFVVSTSTSPEVSLYISSLSNTRLCIKSTRAGRLSVAVMPWKIKHSSVFFRDARSLETATLRHFCQLFPNGHCLPAQGEKAARVVHARR